MNEFDLKLMFNNNPILLKYTKLLQTLSDDRIMCVNYTQDNGFYLVECCDDWFDHKLTKEECLELSEMFKEIAEAIDS